MKQKITKNMTLGEIAENYPEAIDVLSRYGLHCIGCYVAAWETLEQGVAAHGISNKELDKMLKELNNLKEVKNEKNN